MKKILSVLLSTMCLMAITGCSESVKESGNSDSEQKTTEKETASGNNTNKTERKVLVAYFSWSGNTEKIANTIHDEVGGDLFKIEPETAYPTDYDEVIDQAQEEQSTEARPKLKENAANFVDYDVVYLGYPNWWGDMPMLLYTFLESNDFSGKTIIPFCTHGGSGFSGTPNKIKEITGAAVQKGLDVRDSSVDDAAETVKQWLKSIELK